MKDKTSKIIKKAIAGSTLILSTSLAISCQGKNHQESESFQEKTETVEETYNGNEWIDLDQELNGCVVYSVMIFTSSYNPDTNEYSEWLNRDTLNTYYIGTENEIYDEEIIMQEGPNRIKIIKMKEGYIDNTFQLNQIENGIPERKTAKVKVIEHIYQHDLLVEDNVWLNDGYYVIREGELPREVDVEKERYTYLGSREMMISARQLLQEYEYGEIDGMSGNIPTTRFTTIGNVEDGTWKVVGSYILSDQLIKEIYQNQDSIQYVIKLD